jgi:hypothetical protein
MAHNAPGYKPSSTYNRISVMEDETGEITPKCYEIRLKGHLDDRRINSFEGFKAVLLPDGETLLTGPIADQAALHGILGRIRDMNIPLLEIRCLDDPEN